MPNNNFPLKSLSELENKHFGLPETSERIEYEEGYQKEVKSSKSNLKYKKKIQLLKHLLVVYQ
jgi:hypothetical protein